MLCARPGKRVWVADSTSRQVKSTLRVPVTVQPTAFKTPTGRYRVFRVANRMSVGIAKSSVGILLHHLTSHSCHTHTPRSHQLCVGGSVHQLWAPQDVPLGAGRGSTAKGGAPAAHLDRGRTLFGGPCQSGGDITGQIFSLESLPVVATAQLLQLLLVLYFCDAAFTAASAVVATSV